MQCSPKVTRGFLILGDTGVYKIVTPYNETNIREQKKNVIMDLHKALLEILNLKGKKFLLEDKIVNALKDYNAFEFHPAANNIFRILHYEGYLAKIFEAGEWDSSYDHLIYEIERNYAWPRTLIQYIFHSTAYGLGYLNAIQPCFESNHTYVIPTCPVENKPWAKMTRTERLDYLSSKIEIDEPSFTKVGLKVVTYSVIKINKNTSITVCYEIKRIKNSPTQNKQTNFAFAIYDKAGKIKHKEEYYYLKSIDSWIIEEWTLTTDFPSHQISKVLIYLNNFHL